MLQLATLSSFATAYSHSDFFGKLIFLGLYTLSAVCWIVLIYKIREALRVRRLSAAFQSALETHGEQFLAFESKDLPHGGASNPFAHIFFSLKQKISEILNKNVFFSTDKRPFLSRTDLELVESHVLTTISLQSKRLEGNLFILSTIVTLAPFLGLLGTVWGILITFSALNQGGSASSNAVVLSGLSTALATTVLGLVIAIPALVAYNYLKNLTKRLSSDMEDFLYQLLSSVELQYRKADVDR
jgi:biopolymer transport protein TolQ